MNIKPLSDRVVIEPLEAEDKTSGGIYLPDTAKEKPQMGKVVAAGPGKISDAGQKIAMEVNSFTASQNSLIVISFFPLEQFIPETQFTTAHFKDLCNAIKIDYNGIEMAHVKRNKVNMHVL